MDYYLARMHDVGNANLVVLYTSSSFYIYILGNFMDSRIFIYFEIFFLNLKNF
jgi:hypothetical protein